MNVLNAIKVAELRKKLGAIPNKLIFASLILVGIVLYRNGVGDLTLLWEKIKIDWLFYVGAFVFIYGAVSYFAFFMQVLKQWFLGLVVAIGTIAALYFTIGQRDSDILMLVVFVMVLIGPFFDVINFFRYIRLKNKVIEAEEELKQGIEGAQHHDSAYDDGFEEGYRRGMNAGKKDAEEDFSKRIKSKKKKHNDYIEENESEYTDEEEYGWDETDEDGSGDFNGNDYGSEDYAGEDYGSTGNSDGYGSRRVIEGDSGNIAGYFADCKNKKEIKRRYHDLCKVYHPDSGNASSDIFCKINAEYLILMNENEE